MDTKEAVRAREEKGGGTSGHGRATGTLFVFMSAVLFSIGGLCVKIVPWSPLAINGMRNLIAVAIIGVYLKAVRHRIIINPAVLFGAVCLAGTTTLYCMANKLTTAANAIVLQFTAPVFVIFLNWLFFHKKPEKRDVTACVCVFAGIVFFFVDSLSSGNMAGNILAILSGVCYAGVFMMNSFSSSDSLSSILLGQALCAVTCVWFVAGESDFGAAAIGGIVALGVFQLALAYIFMARGLEDTPAVTASLTVAVEPVLNPVLVAVFYHERMTAMALLGAVIVVASVVIYNVGKVGQGR